MKIRTEFLEMSRALLDYRVPVGDKRLHNP